MIKGIIFDYGGTIDSKGEHWSEVIWRGWQLAGLNTDFNVDKETFRDCYVYAERYLAKHPVIEASDDFRRLMEKKIRVELNRFKEIRSDESGISHLEDSAIKIAQYCDDSARKCISEAIPVIRELSLRYPLCIVSNFYGNITAVLEEYGLRHFFSHIIESAVIGVRKPDPRIFKIGCIALDSNPEDTLVVGDSLRKDIEPAESIGCQTAWIKGKGWTTEEDEATHHSQIQNLASLLLI